MDDGVRDKLCDILRNGGILRSKRGPHALLMDCGGWVRFQELAEFIDITPIALFWDICCDL